MNSTIRSGIVFIILLFGFSSVWGLSLEFIPEAGFSTPVGEQANNWQHGYGLGLNIFQSNDKPFQWGVRTSFHRWTPNADEMLRIGSRELHVETNEGWNAITELSVLARYSESSASWVDAGIGIAYMRTSDVKVKGLYNYGSTALNHEINRSGQGEAAPVLTVGLSTQIAGVVRPSLQLKHIIASEHPTSLIFISLGLQAH